MLAQTFNFDERRTITIPGDVKATLQFSANHFIEAYKKAILQKNSFKVALSGGSNPKALFTLLTAPPYVQNIDWSKVHLFWSDERAVSAQDPDSNYHMAMESGFSKVGIPTTQIHRMIAEVSIEKQALAYEELLHKEIPKGFDYLMLGMGEDGHTASLFPQTAGLSTLNRWVIANYIPQKNVWRMTLTFDCINSAQNIVLYVLGKSKQEKVLEIFSQKSGIYPVERVGTNQHKALWILNDEAAHLLLKKL